MSVLALDLGTKTGWCLSATDHGVWDLTPRRFDGGGMRYVRFRHMLDEMHELVRIERVAFEEVRKHRGTDAAHIYGGLMATLSAWCEERGIPYEGVPVGTIKRSWTGKGNADKSVMIAEAIRRGFHVTDDNHADAIALWHHAA